MVIKINKMGFGKIKVMEKLGPWKIKIKGSQKNQK